MESEPKRYWNEVKRPREYILSLESLEICSVIKVDVQLVAIHQTLVTLG